MSLGSSITEYDSGISEHAAEGYENETEFFENKIGLSQDLRFLAGMPELCDVIFIVGEEQAIMYGVKAILAIRSRAFYKMLFGPKCANYSTKLLKCLNSSTSAATVNKMIQRFFSESSSSLKSPTLIRSLSNCQCFQLGKTVVYIDEFEPDVFKQLLEYIHTGSVLLEPKTLLGLLNAADHFSLEELRKVCIKFSRSCIKLDSVCSLLVTAERYIQYKSAKIFVQRVLNDFNVHFINHLLRSSATLVCVNVTVPHFTKNMFGAFYSLLSTQSLLPACHGSTQSLLPAMDHVRKWRVLRFRKVNHTSLRYARLSPY